MKRINRTYHRLSGARLNKPNHVGLPSSAGQVKETGRRSHLESLTMNGSLSGLQKTRTFSACSSLLYIGKTETSCQCPLIRWAKAPARPTFAGRVNII